MKHTKVPLSQSALYRVRSFKRLSQLLFMPIDELEELSSSDSNYMEYNNPSGRWIEAPKPKLKAVQKRFSRLLAQIDTPTYLHSAVRKRSYVSNAAGHSTAEPTVKIDVKKFYGSARSAQVHDFLTVKLQWSGDVAGLMTRILAHNGHLPTGGSASPLLSFWIYRDLFDAVASIATASGSTFSLYVDDMTITGNLVRRSTIHSVRQLVGGARLKAHKVKFFPRGAPKEITGVVQTVKGTKVPYVRQARIREAISILQSAGDDDQRLDALKPLIGRLCEAAEIDPATWKARRDRAIAHRKNIERERLAPEKADATASYGTSSGTEGEPEDAPW